MSANRPSKKSIYETVLFVGTDYRNYRGGVGAVLNTYAEQIRPFKFVATHSNFGAFGNTIYFAKAFIKIFFLLVIDRNIRFVHLHSASRGSFFRKSFVVILSKAFGKKIIFHIHGAEFHLFFDKSPKFLQSYIAAVLNHSDAVICLSNSWLKYFESKIRNKSIQVINNVVKSPELIVSGDKTAADLNLLFLGTLEERKGVFELVESFAAFDEKFRRKIKLVIAGVGDTEKLNGLIDKFQLRETVRYVGWADAKLKNDLLTQCDAFVLPSHNEGLPISILEAMAAGKAIITTPVGGIPEIVKHEHNGLIVMPGDVRGLAKAIEKLYQNPQLLKNYGANSKKAAQAYTPEAVFSSLDNLYGALSDDNQRG